MKSGASRLSDRATVLKRLFEEASRRLLANAPLRFQSHPGGVTLTVAEAEVLESVGLSTTPWKGSDETDPLFRSVVDYMALIETSSSASEAAKNLKVDVSRIRQRIRERSLFSLEYEGEYRLPLFQFERRQVLPGLRDVLAALPEELNPLDVAQWFLSPNIDLESELGYGKSHPSPRDWLIRGEPVGRVVELARGFE
jgi:hypothetical protein